MKKKVLIVQNNFKKKDTFANDYRINTMKYNFFAMSRAWNLKQLCVPDFGLQ